MKKTLHILFFLLLLALPSAAQVKIGFFSYNAMLESMPQYQTVLKDQKQLQTQYDAEMQRAENEFNSKYEEFLESYQTYATSIRQKRQAELKDLMQRNVQFREESDRLLKESEETAMRPLREKLDATIKSVAQKFGYSIILNTDSGACPYIDQTFAEDVSTLLKESLESKEVKE